LVLPSLEAKIDEAAEIPLPVLDTVHVQEVLAAVDSVEVVAEGAHCEVRVVAEFGVTHELGVWKLDHACLQRLGGLLELVGEHLGKVNLVGVVAVAAKDDDLELPDLSACSWLVDDEVRAWDHHLLPFGLLE